MGPVQKGCEGFARTLMAVLTPLNVVVGRRAGGDAARPPAPSRERKGPKAPLQGPALALRVGGPGEGVVEGGPPG